MVLNMSKIKKIRAADIFSFVFILIIIILILYPLMYAILGSLKTNQELTLGSSYFPAVPQWDNYRTVFTRFDFFSYTMNSVMLAAGVTVLAMINSSLTGYVLARYSFPGKKPLMYLYLAFMFVSVGTAGFLPLYLLLKSLHMTNIVGMIIVMVGGQGTNVFLTMGYINSVPRDFDEAALIDGCSYTRIFFSIIIPLVRPILAVVALFTFRSAWNEYLIPLIMTLGQDDFKTLTVGIVELKYSPNAAMEWHLMCAGACVALLPILVIYLFTNKQFIGGLTAGGVKG